MGKRLWVTAGATLALGALAAPIAVFVYLKYTDVVTMVLLSLGEESRHRPPPC